MAGLMDILGEALNQDATSKIGAKLGADDESVQNGISTALPVLIEALTRNTEQQGGAEQLASALERDHDGSLLDDVSGFIDRGEDGQRSTAGGRILEHMLGGKRSRVENAVSQASGLQSGATSQLLEMLAPMVMAGLGRRKQQNNLSPGGLSDLLGRDRSSMQDEEPQKATMMGRLFDQDGDGDFDASDVLRLVGKKVFGSFFGK